MEVVEFLNELYTVMDSKIDNHDVYKVETISDSYMVVSGVPKPNGDKHATEICNMALSLQKACRAIQRPDTKPKTIIMKAGIHTGLFIHNLLPMK